MGDLSDIDGFMALPLYKATGADVMFIMNYPAYLACDDDTVNGRSFEGRGFNYGVKNYVAALDAKIGTRKGVLNKGNGKQTPLTPNYLELKDKYKLASPSPSGMWRCLMDTAYVLCKKVWESTTSTNPAQKLYFVDGGINTVNPFSADWSNFLPAIYYDDVTQLNGMFSGANLPSEQYQKRVNAQHQVFAVEEAKTQLVDTPYDNIIAEYDSVFMDMNGSAAFYEAGVFRDEKFKGKIKGLHVMGGVNAEDAPQTIPPNENVNRFTGATMNQVYAPEKALDLLRDLSFHVYTYKNASGENRLAKLPIVVTSNNTVNNFPNVKAFPANGDAYTLLYKNLFYTGRVSLSRNSDAILQGLANKFYSNQVFSTRPKPYDMFSALSLVTQLTRGVVDSPESNLYFNSDYGLSYITPPERGGLPAEGIYEKIKTLGEPSKTELATLFDGTQFRPNITFTIFQVFDYLKNQTPAATSGGARKKAATKKKSSSTTKKMKR
jgi:hypothetical protein